MKLECIRENQEFGFSATKINQTVLSISRTRFRRSEIVQISVINDKNTQKSYPKRDEKFDTKSNNWDYLIYG